MQRPSLTISCGKTSAQLVHEKNTLNFLKSPLLRGEYYLVGISLWLVRVICLVVSPSSLLQPAAAEREMQKILMLYKYYSPKYRTLGCYQYCFDQKSKLQNHV